MQQIALLTLDTMATHSSNSLNSFFQKRGPMHIATLWQHQYLQVTVQSSTESTGPEVLYRIPTASRVYPRLSNILLDGMSLSQDHIRMLHQAAISKIDAATVQYPALSKYTKQIEEVTRGTV